MPGNSSLTSVSTKQQRIADLARQMPDKPMTSLSHHMDLEWMFEAYRRTRKDGAVGIDGRTAKDYEANMETNLQSLLDRAKSGDHYKAPPVRRVHIPKGDGSTRPLGIPTFEDKVLQRAVVMVLEPLYEQDFLNCSHGFRSGRSAHQALVEIQSRLTRMGGGWVLDVDIRKYFDSLDHVHLREILAKRMCDGVIKRLIGKWLNAGVMEAGVLRHPDSGTPQGGVISPLLANIYLHEVLDVWFEQEVKLRLKGLAFLVRYADDFVMGFTREDDARRVMAVLPKRFGKYGLTLHPDKTRLLDFRSQRNRNDSDNDEGPGSFDFLGFTHHWAKSRKGNWVVKQKTSKSRFTRAIKRVNEWCRSYRHRPVPDQHKALSQKLRGHFGYFGITGNSMAIDRFRTLVLKLWKKWLSRRSQRGRLNWEQYRRLLESYPLPPARSVHSIYRYAANP
jgi:group II intron reverse transcriptase/maturase